ncbi:DsbA family protein [Streptomyces acidicola]|uniref:DsbA family protein n=1 Tax=Streptomyces acidicola TaxID=2596892 RepID=UPI0037930CB8
MIGLDFHLDSAIATNTRTAHRLIHWAGSQGRQHGMVERLFRAYFTEGLDVGDHDVLAGLAAELGLDPTAAREALDGDAFDADFEADVRQAARLGITGVPFFVFDGQYAVSGAQPVEAFLQALDTAWKNKFARTSS